MGMWREREAVENKWRELNTSSSRAGKGGERGRKRETERVGEKCSEMTTPLKTEKLFVGVGQVWRHGDALTCAKTHHPRLPAQYTLQTLWYAVICDYMSVILHHFMMDSFSFSGLVDRKSSFIFGGDIIRRAVWVMGFLVAIIQLSLTVIKSVKITGNILYIYVCVWGVFFFTF